LAEFLQATNSDSANVVLASYSLHHFSSEEKIALIAEIHRVLAVGGTFFWIDAVRRDNQSRDQYIHELTSIMASDWTALSADDREKACAHVRESDFPETRSWMVDQVAKAGFDPPTNLLQQEFFSGWAFKNP
jgi:ubiquinone/menaquinone biosynthesis C-methylase UbiE